MTSANRGEPASDAVATRPGIDRAEGYDTNGRNSPAGACLAVGNYAPNVGFAWWLMENFWLQLQDVARAHELHTVIAYPAAGEIPESILHGRLEIVTQPFPGHGALQKWRALQLVRHHKIKLIYLTDRAFTAWFYLPLRLFGVRCIINHDHTPGDRPKVAGLRGVFKALVAKLPWVNCDLEFVVSPHMRTRAMDNARLPPERVIVVQNGIQPMPPPADRHYAHKLLNLEPSTQICISAGRVTEYKRVGFILEVARRVKNDPSLTSLVFIHCGDGPDLDTLRARVDRDGLHQHVRLLGRREDTTALMQSASLALHPSRGEAFSLAIVEYMRAAVPVVVPDVPSVCQAVEPGVTGLVYRDGDVDDAARAIGRLVRNREFAAELGRNGSERVLTKYSIEETNRQFREALRTAFTRVGRTLAGKRHACEVDRDG